MSTEQKFWEANTSTEPLTIDTIKRGMAALFERDGRIAEARAAWGEAYRALTPEERKRTDAVHQAIMELTGQEPDPINPVVVHPEMAKRIWKRADEILDEL